MLLRGPRGPPASISTLRTSSYNLNLGPFSGSVGARSRNCKQEDNPSQNRPEKSGVWRSGVVPWTQKHPAHSSSSKGRGGSVQVEPWGEARRPALELEVLPGAGWRGAWLLPPPPGLRGAAALALVFRRAEVSSASCPGIWTPALLGHPGVPDALGLAEALLPRRPSSALPVAGPSGHGANARLAAERRVTGI